MDESPKVSFAKLAIPMVVIFALCLAIAYFYTLSQPESFSSTSIVLVRKNGNWNSQRLLTDAQVVESLPVIRPVVSQLRSRENGIFAGEGGKPLSELAAVKIFRNKHLRVRSQNSGIIKIKVLSPNANEASFAANAMAESYLTFYNEQMKDARGALPDIFKKQNEAAQKKVAEAEAQAALAAKTGKTSSAVKKQKKARENLQFQKEAYAALLKKQDQEKKEMTPVSLEVAILQKAEPSAFPSPPDFLPNLRLAVSAGLIFGISAVLFNLRRYRPRRDPAPVT